MRLLSCAVFLAVIGLPAAASTVAKPLSDARLDRKVTYEARCESVHKVLEDITAQTNVPLRCGTSKRNWQVRDRRVTMFVKDMPLKDFQKALASVLHFSWTTFDGKSGRSYRLVQTASQRVEELVETPERPTLVLKKQTARMKAAISGIESITSLSKEDVDRLKTSDPMLYVLAKHPIGKATANLLSNLPPEAKEALLAQTDYAVQVDELSPEAREAARAFVEAADDFASRVDPDFAEAKKRPIDLDGRVIRINADQMPDSSDVMQWSYLGTIVIDAGRYGLFPIMDPKSAATRAMGRLYAQILDGASPKKVFGNETGDRALIEAMIETGEFDGLKRDDPDLDNTVKLDVKQTGVRFIDALAALSKASGLQIIADHFDPDPSLEDLNAENKLGATVQRFAILADKKVTKDGNVLLFEDRQRIEKRSWEIPRDLITRVKEAVADGTFNLDDAAAVAQLTDAQIMHTLGRSPAPEMETLVGCAGLYCYGKIARMLRLYGSLSASQRALLSSEEGIPVSNLKDSLWPVLGFRAPEYDRMTLKLVVKESGSQALFFLLGPQQTEPRGEPPENASSLDVALPQIAGRPIYYHLAIPLPDRSGE